MAHSAPPPPAKPPHGTMPGEDTEDRAIKWFTDHHHLPQSQPQINSNMRLNLTMTVEEPWDGVIPKLTDHHHHPQTTPKSRRQLITQKKRQPAC